MHDHAWIHDWNDLEKTGPLSPRNFTLLDETLRDGIQSPSVVDPPIEHKRELLHLMASLGVGAADIGLPGAGRRAREDVLALAEEIRDSKLAITPVCAARTVIPDIEPIAEISQRVGIPIEVYAFVGSSPIRLFTESWTVDDVIGHVEQALTFSRKENLEVCLVTEDTTRSHPDTLEPLFRFAVEEGGVRRLCLCDTVGHATPDGVRNLFGWTWDLIRSMGHDVHLGWHGHNDRGLGVTNALIAIEQGAERIHGTGLGVGERVGNAALDQILLNLKLLGAWEHDVTDLLFYCEAVARACGVPIPHNYPLAGKDAFRTATGVHAAAIIKAQKKGDHYLADRVYSGIPAGMFGRHQEIEISHMSGASNVIYWLEARRIDPTKDLVADILAKAKASNRVLTAHEVLTVVRAHDV